MKSSYVWVSTFLVHVTAENIGIGALWPSGISIIYIFIDCKKNFCLYACISQYSYRKAITKICHRINNLWFADIILLRYTLLISKISQQSSAWSELSVWISWFKLSMLWRMHLAKHFETGQNGLWKLYIKNNGDKTVVDDFCFILCRCWRKTYKLNEYYIKDENQQAYYVYLELLILIDD